MVTTNLMGLGYMTRWDLPAKSMRPTLDRFHQKRYKRITVTTTLNPAATITNRCSDGGWGVES